tara:strand:+ start:7717 stop:8304 length:588 start_codon:yes stop_codon:yes gene_type:complete
MSYFFVGDLNILKDKRLTPIDRLVYFSLVSFMSSKDGKCFPRYATIKRDLGISKASINRSIKHLAKLKLITVKRLSSTNLYLLSQQIELEKNRIKRLKSQFDSTDVSERHLLIKPSLYNYNTRNVNKYQRGKFISPPTANHSKTTLDYNGDQYEYFGEFGEYIEYRNKKGEVIAKHKWKKNEPIKKFDASVKEAS